MLKSRRMYVYWYCYAAVVDWHIQMEIVDRILTNFNRTAGLFHSILYTKLFALLLMALSCLGTKGVKEEKITWSRIWAVLGAGFVFYFIINWWMLLLRLSKIRPAFDEAGRRHRSEHLL